MGSVVIPMAKHEVCKKADVPEGEGRTFSVDGKEIAVFNIGGEFYAIDNTCVHRGGPLGEGTLDGEEVVCPWHGWRYSVKDGVSPVNSEARVGSYPITVDGEKLTIEL